MALELITAARALEFITDPAAARGLDRRTGLVKLPREATGRLTRRDGRIERG